MLALAEDVRRGPAAVIRYTVSPWSESRFSMHTTLGKLEDQDWAIGIILDARASQMVRISTEPKNGA